MKTFPGIIVRQHLTVQKQMGLLRKRYAGSRKGSLLYCCNQVWMKNGGRIPWILTAICETYKISCLMGRHPMEGDSEYHFMARLFRLERWSNITYFCQRPVATASVRPESLLRKLPRLCIVVGWNLERRHFGRRH